MGLTVPGMGKQAIVDMIYPVGSIYMSTVNITPAAVFGGKWEAIRGKFLLAESDNHAAGSTGGEEAHALTGPEGPKHAHEFNDYWGVPSGTEKGKAGAYNSSGNVGGSTAYAGEGKPHNNMPPYLAVYVWKRIA